MPVAHEEMFVPDGQAVVHRSRFVWKVANDAHILGGCLIFGLPFSMMDKSRDAFDGGIHPGGRAEFWSKIRPEDIRGHSKCRSKSATRNAVMQCIVEEGRNGVRCQETSMSGTNL